MIKRKLKSLINKKPKKMANADSKAFFVHIPKTAGTSFRDAIEMDYEVLADYGAKSQNTSNVVLDNVYGNGSVYYFKLLYKEKKNCWLCGHIPLQKYIDFVPIQKVVSFVREPIEQVVSHYNHFVSYSDYDGNIEKFVDRPGAFNIQSRTLSAVPISLIGYVGITERFEESLDIINDAFDANFLAQKNNVNQTKSLSTDVLSKKQKKLIFEKSSRDYDFYNEALFLHELRYSFMLEQKEWTYAYVNINSNNMLNGCAYYANQDKAVEIVVFKNGNEIDKILADGFYNGFPKANFPRERYISFHYSLSKVATKEDVIDLYVASTGQKLNFKSLMLKF